LTAVAVRRGIFSGDGYDYMVQLFEHAMKNRRNCDLDWRSKLCLYVVRPHVRYYVMLFTRLVCYALIDSYQTFAISA